jgi:hypothetical protein
MSLLECNVQSFLLFTAMLDPEITLRSLFSDTCNLHFSIRVKGFIPIKNTFGLVGIRDLAIIQASEFLTAEVQDSYVGFDGGQCGSRVGFLLSILAFVLSVSVQCCGMQ